MSSYKMLVEVMLIHGHVIAIRCDNFYTATDDDGRYTRWIAENPHDVVDFPAAHIVGWRIRD